LTEVPNFIEDGEPLPLPAFVTRITLHELLEGKTLSELEEEGAGRAGVS